MIGSISIVIPTVEGREEYLERCLLRYAQTAGAIADLDFIVQEDYETCGLAWEEGASRARGDYIHLTADDIVPGDGWLEPMAEAVDENCIPVALVVTATPDIIGEDKFPKPGNPVGPHSFFFEAHGTLEDTHDWQVAEPQMSEYPSVPFCTSEQWQRIRPMLPLHYGTDRWFGWRALQAGFPSVVRNKAFFYHYAAQEGRVPRYHGWTHSDLVTFDMSIAYPDYLHGRVPLTMPHPLRGTLEGRRVTRHWYRSNVSGPPWPWEDPNLPEVYR